MNEQTPDRPLPGGPKRRRIPGLGLDAHRPPPQEDTVTSPSARPAASAAGCNSFRSGHCLHWIPGMKSGSDSDPTTKPARATVTAVEADGWITLLLNGETQRVWTHDLTKVLDRFTPGTPLPCTVSLYWGVLGFPEARSTPMISVAEERTACVTDEPTGDLAEDLDRFGGIFVKGPDALAWADHQRKAADKAND
ncbi:MAG: hypothetical protein ACOYN0_17825 [Phycisphaerales bacterium]